MNSGFFVCFIRICQCSKLYNYIVKVMIYKCFLYNKAESRIFFSHHNAIILVASGQVPSCYAIFSNIFYSR